MTVLDQKQLARAVKLAEQVQLTGGPIKPRNVKLLAKVLLALHDDRVQAVLDALGKEPDAKKSVSPLVAGVIGAIAGAALVKYGERVASSVGGSSTELHDAEVLAGIAEPVGANLQAFKDFLKAKKTVSK